MQRAASDCRKHGRARPARRDPPQLALLLSERCRARSARAQPRPAASISAPAAPRMCPAARNRHAPRLAAWDRRAAPSTLSATRIASQPAVISREIGSRHGLTDDVIRQVAKHGFVWRGGCVELAQRIAPPGEAHLTDDRLARRGDCPREPRVECEQRGQGMSDPLRRHRYREMDGSVDHATALERPRLAARHRSSFVNHVA